MYVHSIQSVYFEVSISSFLWGWFINYGYWYVSNVSVIYEVFMLLYYHSWMFYNHLIATLYHFLGLTYWTSAQCQLLFLLVFYIAVNQYQTESKHREIFCGFFMDQKTSNGLEQHLGVPRGRNNPPGRAWAPDAPRWVVPTSVASRTRLRPINCQIFQKPSGRT